MKSSFPITLSLALAALSLPVLAHDPSLHQQKDAVPPDCTAMKDMDEMDMSDPLMKALHDRCKDSMVHDPLQRDMKDMPGMEKKAEQPSNSGGK